MRLTALKCMLSEAYQRVATLQLGSNCCNFIAFFAAHSSATLKFERALRMNIILTQDNFST